MPIYEYECSGCGNRFEVLQRMDDKDVPTCLICGSGEVNRLISTAGFVLKGSGWYTTDYPSKARKEGLEKEKKGLEKEKKSLEKEKKALEKPAETKKESPKASD